MNLLDKATIIRARLLASLPHALAPYDTRRPPASGKQTIHRAARAEKETIASRSSSLATSSNPNRLMEGTIHNGSTQQRMIL